MRIFSIIIGFAVFSVAVGCASAGDGASEAALPLVPNQPELVIGRVGPYISGTDPFPIPPEHAGVCEQVAELANRTRAKGELFYAISAPYREIVPPNWEPLDYRDYVEMLVESSYDGWCDELYRVNAATGEPFSETERVECREAWKNRTRKGLRGDLKLERANIDIDRDGDEEVVYQLFADPNAIIAELGRDVDFSVNANFLMPGVYLSRRDDLETAKKVDKVIITKTSLFYWRDGLYALSGGYDHEYRINLITFNATIARLGSLPICMLQSGER